MLLWYQGCFSGIRGYLRQQVIIYPKKYVIELKIDNIFFGGVILIAVNLQQKSYHCYISNFRIL